MTQARKRQQQAQQAFEEAMHACEQNDFRRLLQLVVEGVSLNQQDARVSCLLASVVTCPLFVSL